MEDEVWGPLGPPSKRPKLAVVGGGTRNEGAFSVHTFFRNEADIPPRPWIAPGMLIRRGVTMIYGPPDQGKSLLLIAWSVALALGVKWGRFTPRGPMRVLIIMSEEDDDEQNLRFAAAFRAFGARRGDVEPNLRRLVVQDTATMLDVAPQSSVVVSNAAWEKLMEQVREFKPDVVILDPLVEFHSAEENNNTALKAVIAQFRNLARYYNCSVVLSHHMRKVEKMIPGCLDQARGASAIGGAVRIAITFLEMSEDEANDLGIQLSHRRYFCRIDHARASQAPPAIGSGEWVEKIGYTLDNGDETPALRPWTPPESVAHTDELVLRLIADIGRGCPTAAGRPWSYALLDNEPRSVRQLLRKHDVTRQGERAILQALYDAGVARLKFRNIGVDRHPIAGLRTADGRPSAQWIEPQDEAGE